MKEVPFVTSHSKFFRKPIFIKLGEITDVPFTLKQVIRFHHRQTFTNCLPLDDKYLCSNHTFVVNKVSVRGLFECAVRKKFSKSPYRLDRLKGPYFS